MRSANFRMGFDQTTSYRTTTEFNNKHLHQSPKVSQKDRSDQLQAQKDRVTKNRRPNYDFGRDMVNYQSMSKNNF